jgi:hypothetical protein
MKKGKFITVGNHNNVKIGYGTVDSKNLKTIYIQLNSWTQPLVEETNFDKLISKTQRRIKDTIYNLKYEYFKKESIVDLDIKTNGIKITKRSFMDLEITLFVEKPFDVRSAEIKTIINNLSTNIIDNVLTDQTLFNFHEKKLS